jgi:hypothetical protein
MSVFYLQRQYTGREANILRSSTNKHTIHIVDSIDLYGDCSHTPIVGTVEWVEQNFKSFVPDYYPSWTEEIWHRKITKDPRGLSARKQFVKPADRYKRFDARVLVFPDPKCSQEINEFSFAKGPFVFSEVVEFENEWRYYISNGKVLASWWYDGDEETSENDPNGPVFPISIPDDYCGAVDLGILTTGELALVEAHHPYSIGWYGENTQEDRDIYLKFLSDGWNYLQMSY